MEILLITSVLALIIYYSIDYYLSIRLKKYKYDQFIKELKAHSQSKSTHYFSKTCINRINKKEYIPIPTLEFFIKLDIYYSNIDLQTLIYHRSIYIKKNPEHTKVIDLYNRIVHMKVKDYIYNIH